MTTQAIVRLWHDEEGWGVLDCAETPGGCWAGFADVAVAGHRTLPEGRRVHLEWEVAHQHGYAFRATRVWPVGQDPVESVRTTHSTAYRSTLVIDGELVEDPESCRDR